MNEQTTDNVSSTENTPTPDDSLSPAIALSNGLVYWMSPPKARPYIKVQNDIRMALDRGGVSEEQQRWLFDKEMEAAHEAEKNMPSDNHPYVRMALEIGKCSAFCVTFVLIAAVCYSFRTG